jgi:monomeric isocitrate dehydrogenase
VHSFGWYMAQLRGGCAGEGRDRRPASPIPHRDRYGSRTATFATFADGTARWRANNGALFMDLTMLVSDGYRNRVYAQATVTRFFSDARTHTNEKAGARWPARFNAARDRRRKVL